MDVRLVGRALQFHGIELMRKINEEQQEQPSAAVLSYLDRRQAPDLDIKDDEFQKKMCTFIGRKADLLFKPLTEEEKARNQVDESIDDSYAIMPAIETFMDVPSHLRREHFYRSLRPDDCVTGVVTSILDNGLRVHLLCVDRGRARDIEDLDIVAFCPAKELPKLYAHESALDAFQEKDIVRGIVLSVSAETERVIMSLHERSIPDQRTYPRIGLITEEEFPVHFRRKSQIQGMSYDDMMHSILGFNNQGNVKSLVKQQGIQESNSYLRCHARLKIPEKEYAEGLNKWQSQKLAHQSVAQGVEMFKDGKYLEAMQHFNRALQIDKQNVEALVARGALYANKENFNHAIQDFEEALLVNPKHNNARNYLIETLLTVGKICEDSRQLDEACDRYSQVLKLDPAHAEATEMLESCRRLMAFQATAGSGDLVKEGKGKGKDLGSSDEDDAEQDSSKSKATVLKKTAEKLRQLIQEDEKGKSSGKKKKEFHHRNSSKDSKKRKAQRRRSSSSSSSSSSDSSSGSRSSSSSTSDGERRRKRRNARKSRQDSVRSDQSLDKMKVDRKRLSPSAQKDRDAREREEILARRRSLERQGRKEGIKEEVGVRTKERSPELKSKTEDDSFSERIQANAVSSFMPVSSFDYFNRSAAIPGLGSPPPSDNLAADIAKSQSVPQDRQAETGRNIERERPAADGKNLRRDDYLMAEREKFYRDNRDRYKRFRPHSRSRSRSRSSSRSSRSSSLSKSGHRKGKSYDRKGSRSRTRSPVITGVKELDMYLGGAKKLLARSQLGEKFNTLEYFTGSGSIPVRVDSSKGRMSPDTGSRLKSRGPDDRRSRSGSRSQRSRSHSRSKYETKDKEISPKPGTRQFSKEHGGPHPVLSGIDRDREKLHVMEQTRSRWDENEMGERDRTGRPTAKDVVRVKQEPLLETSKRDLQERGEEQRSKARGERDSHNDDKEGSVDDRYAIYKEEELQKAGSTQRRDASTKAFADDTKPKAGAFMPRILRMPKMDDPSLNKLLLSSNQLSALEKEKMKRKIEEREKQTEKAKESEHADQKDRTARHTDGSISKKSGGKKRGRKDRRSSSSSSSSNSSSGSSSSDRKSRSLDRKRKRKDSRESRKRSRSRDSHRSVRSRSHGREDEKGEPDQKLKSEEIEKKRRKEAREAGDDVSRKGEKVDESDNNIGDGGKKFLAQDDIEKEIERRVQQRLKEEEERLRKAVVIETTVLRKSKWDSEEFEYKEGLKKKTEEASALVKVVSDIKNDSSTKKPPVKGSGESSPKSRKGTKDVGRGCKVVETNQGWTIDEHGNRYFAIRGTVSSEGWHKDKYGTLYYIRHGGHNGKGKESGSERRSRSRGRRRSRSRSRGRRSRSRSRSRHRSRSRSRDRRRRTRSHSRHRRSRSKNRSRSRSRDRRRRTRSRSRRRGSRSKDMSKSEQGLREQVGSLQTPGAANSETSTTNKTSAATATLLPSKWDGIGASKWEIPQSSSEMKEPAEKTEGEKKDKDEEKKGKDKKGKEKHSLTELEKFLIDLKQQKKKQWIAEGKVKKKD